MPTVIKLTRIVIAAMLLATPYANEAAAGPAVKFVRIKCDNFKMMLKSLPRNVYIDAVLVDQATGGLVSYAGKPSDYETGVFLPGEHMAVMPNGMFEEITGLGKLDAQFAEDGSELSLDADDVAGCHIDTSVGADPNDNELVRIRINRTGCSLGVALDKDKKYYFNALAGGKTSYRLWWDAEIEDPGCVSLGDNGLFSLTALPDGNDPWPHVAALDYGQHKITSKDYCVWDETRVTSIADKLIYDDLYNTLPYNTCMYVRDYFSHALARDEADNLILTHTLAGSDALDNRHVALKYIVNDGTPVTAEQLLSAPGLTWVEAGDPRDTGRTHEVQWDGEGDTMWTLPVILQELPAAAPSRSASSVGRSAADGFPIGAVARLDVPEPGESTAMGVVTTDTEPAASVFYTLDGTRVDKPAAPGVYVRRCGARIDKVMVK